ncbi:MAG: tol-pal system protein YbgF [Nitrospiraceae bacterium]|nr:MAG: tol-pal system protein YbgF [Nitrospiraceae bacterium]
MIIKRPVNIYTVLYCLLFTLSLAFLLSGCATTDDMGRMQWNINDLRSEIKSIKETAPSQVEREKLDRNFQEIRQANELTSKSVSDLLVQTQSLANEFRTLTGRFEETRYHADKNSAEMKAEREKLAAKLGEMELALDDVKKKVSHLEEVERSAKKDELKQDEGTKQPDDAAKTGETEKKTPEKTEDKKEAPKPDVKDIYLAGYQAYNEGKTVEAREKLSTVLKDYPDNEYTDNARFWIAESYYKDGNYEDAILAYEEILKKSPKSDKVPGVLLKQGLAFYALKDEKTGRIILEKLIQEHPKSDQAGIAKKKLGNPAPAKKKK